MALPLALGGALLMGAYGCDSATSTLVAGQGAYADNFSGVAGGNSVAQAPGGAGGHGGAAGAGGGAGDSAGAGATGDEGGDLGDGGKSGAPSGGAGDGGSGAGAPALSDFAIEPNPNMTISCFVSWRTAEPATSEVDFGESDYAFRIRDPKLVTEHRVLVIGMHAETKYRIRAVSTSSDGTDTAQGDFTTGALPATLPVPELTVSDPERSHVGWTLTSIQVGTNEEPLHIVIYDAEGLPVWYFIDGSTPAVNGAVSTALLESSVMLGPSAGEPAREVDLSGEVLWEGPPQTSSEPQSHYGGKTPAGTYILNYQMLAAVEGDSGKVDDQRLDELTPDLDVVWSWRLLDHLPAVGERADFCHGNTLKLVEGSDIAYYNCRYLGLLKFDRASGDILWRLGGSYDETSLGPGDFTYDPPESRFSNAHEPEPHADGTILFYDNGGPTEPPSGPYHSRVVEYAVDEQAMTATRTFEFPGEFPVDAWYKDDWYTPFWGDADRLENGNILVTAGMRSMTHATRIFEITRQGEVVWELTFPTFNGSYQAERLSPPPLVEPMP